MRRAMTLPQLRELILTRRFKGWAFMSTPRETHYADRAALERDMAPHSFEELKFLYPHYTYDVGKERPQ